MLRQVGQTVGVGTISKDISLPDAQVRLVLEGGPLVAGGRAVELKRDDVTTLQAVQAAIDGAQPNVDQMRGLYGSLVARAGAGDNSAVAALVVLQRQAAKAGVDLNPPPPPLPILDGDSSADDTGGADGSGQRSRILRELKLLQLDLAVRLRAEPNSARPPEGFGAKLWNFVDKVFGFSSLGKAFDAWCEGTGSTWDLALAVGRTSLLFVGSAALVGAAVVLGAYALGATALLAAVGGTIGTVFIAGSIVTIAAFGGGWTAMDATERGATAEDVAVEGLRGAFATAPLGLLGLGARTKEHVDTIETSGVPEINTPYGPAVQVTSSEAMAMRQQVGAGGRLYRGGFFGKQNVADAQFWATENPLNPGYAERYGTAYTGKPDYVIAGSLRPGQKYITRVAPPVEPNPGGGIEVVTNPEAVHIDWFYMPD